MYGSGEYIVKTAIYISMTMTAMTMKYMCEKKANDSQCVCLSIKKIYGSNGQYII